jgi:hypothetical protein
MAEGWTRVFDVLLRLLPGGLWCAWWLWAVNWKKVWPALAAGAWVPVVLLVVLSALGWSMIFPSTCNCLGFVTLPNFWWQLGSCAALAAVALFCGWLQGQFGWTPEDVDFEPPAAEHGHEHGHH